jgi:LPXTG-site transpeptidase (sortase) family protein
MPRFSGSTARPRRRPLQPSRPRSLRSLKTSVPIVLSFAVGALVVFALHSHAWAAAEPAKSARSAAEPVVRAYPVSAPMRGDLPTIARRPNRVQGPAQLAIPRLHLKLAIGKNVDDGPAWWPVTGRPGGGDTIAIAGHRTTHTHPFLDLDVLRARNAIYVRWQGVMYRYVVTGSRVLSNRQQHIADARGHEVLILSTCTPKGSSRQRLVVYAVPEA